MNKSIILILVPCLVAFVMAQQYGYQSGYQSGGYPAYYQNQLNAYTQQRRLYNYGNAATAQLKGAKLLNYLFGFLLLLDLTNATGNSLSSNFLG
ncbi:uncharacterized protein [Mytilus edulis]|uniref:uncharacterized protein n=1 Tax=Mytilus edulis TaxID=6550 RepID=UPI0039EFD59B